MSNLPFDTLKGLTLVRVEVSDDKELVTLVTDTGRIFKMYHSQDCCESVEVEDVVGDLADLIGTPILQAEGASSSDTDPDGFDPKRAEWRESYTWTFYKLATIRGSVTIRWYGTSNGYYSESVEFVEGGK